MYDQAGYFYFFDVIYYYKRIYKNFDMNFTFTIISSSCM